MMSAIAAPGDRRIESSDRPGRLLRGSKHPQGIRAVGSESASLIPQAEKGLAVCRLCSNSSKHSQTGRTTRNIELETSDVSSIGCKTECDRLNPWQTTFMEIGF